MAVGKKTKKKIAKKAKPRKAAVKKTAKKKAKKTVSKRWATKKIAKKKVTTNKAAKKKASKKSGKKSTAPRKRSAAGTGMVLRKEPVEIVPGPPAGEVPPVEEPARHEQAVGVVTHYYSHLGVAVVQLNTGTIRTGDPIRIKGHTTDFTQDIQSIEYEHRHVEEAVAGQCVGLKVIDHAREHDIVYLE